MSVTLKRYNWTTQTHERIPVNETLLQEICDTLFSRNEIWAQDLDQFRRRIRYWQQHLYEQTPEPSPAPPLATITDGSGNPVEAAVTVSPTDTWPQFLSVARKAGKSATEAGAMWNAFKKAERVA